MQNPKTCFAFWIDPQDGKALKEALDSRSKRMKRKIGLPEILWPALKKFIESEQNHK